MPDEPNKHSFGGEWTERKLKIIEKYLSAYTTVMKYQPFRTSYIDAFAGTGYRAERGSSRKGTTDPLLLPELAEEAPQKVLEGSVRRALRTVPSYDYTFVEKSKVNHKAFLGIKDEFPHLASKIRIIQGDANSAIRTLCSEDWSLRRAVLFLDPYGMQVDWSTIVAIAGTRAIDLWLLFPQGMAVNRILKHANRFPAWRARLDRQFGTEDWYDELLPVSAQQPLFGGDEQRSKVEIDQIGRYFVRRLQSIFPAVSKNPAVLGNSTCPLYLLCFAAGNKRGGKVALDIANHILKAEG
jgi:three-Cys-motif partner protein